MKISAFTQIIVTVAVTAWVFILPVMAVATILVLELALLLSIKHDRMTMAAIGGLAVFTGLMVLLQLLFGSPLEIALVGGLRMLVMTMAFLCMLAATRIQDIAQALVTKFHLPCEYAFMLTTRCALCLTFWQTVPLLWTRKAAVAIPTAAMRLKG